MANQTGRPIAPARKLVAAVLGTLAVFVMVFGLGLTSWGIVVLGLAMLALSIALGLVNVVRRGARAWVSGTAQVKAVSEPPVSSAYGRAELQLVVVAPGLPVTEVLVRDPRVPVDKWPRPGETLPVTVDVDDMRRVRIDWLNAPDHADPPPPGPSYQADAYPDPLDDYDDDLLGEPDPPPWAARERPWEAGPDEPPPPPPPRVADAGDFGDLPDSPVVVRDTPEGPVVEGQLVDTDPPPPPRRARSGPIPSPAPPADAPAPEHRPAGTRPSPRARATPGTATAASGATATVDAGAASASGGTDAPPHTAAPEQRPASESGDEPIADADEPAAGGSIDLGLDDPAPAAAATTEAPARPTHDPEIDLPLDGDPEPPPETTDPAAREAVASGLMAPPADETTPAHDFAPPEQTTPPDETNARSQSGTDEQHGPWADLEGGFEPDDRTGEIITAYPSARPGPAGAIHGVGITALVTNLDRSVAFYRDILGFFEIDRGPGSAVLASGDTRLVLRTVHDLSGEVGRLIYLNLEVGDVEAVYQELKAKGVVFVHAPRAVNRGGKLELWSATFTDPDLHNIAISQWRAI